MKGQKGDGMDLKKTYELNNALPSQHPWAFILCPSAVGVCLCQVDVAAALGTVLSRTPSYLCGVSRQVENRY